MASSRAWRSARTGLVFAVALGASVARAAEPDARIRTAARELALSGAEAFDKQDYGKALDRFQRAESLYKAPSITVMVARCLSRLGRVVEAVDKYEETRRSPLDASAPEAFQRAVAEAAAEEETVRSRIARLELRLPPDAPSDTQVLLDGKPLPPAMLGVPVPVDPGRRRLTAQAAGHAPYGYEVTLAEGARETVEIALSPSAREGAAPGARAAQDGSGGSGKPSVLAIALLGGGGVALSVGAVTGIAALGHKSSLDERCSPGCPSDMASELAAYRRDRALSYLSFGVGLAAAGAGTYFLLHRGQSGSQVGALVFPGGAALRGRF